MDENGDEKSEYIDPRFRFTEKVTVYYTLPNGNDEILLNYPMVFADKQRYQNFKDGNIPIPDFGIEENNSQAKPVLDYDFKLCKLV